MSKVYLLTDGEYSDYHVTGVYSTRENAELMRGHIGGDIEEHDLDPGIDKICAGRKLTNIAIKRDGSVSGISLAKGIEIYARLLMHVYQTELQLTCWAKDFAHAVHIAGEARRMLLAENLWPETLEEYNAHPLRGEFDKHIGAVLDRAVEVVEGRGE